MLMLFLTLLDQCALRPDGSLKEASEIDWVNDPDENIPESQPTGTSFTLVLMKSSSNVRQAVVADVITQHKWLKLLMQS